MLLSCQTCDHLRTGGLLMRTLPSLNRSNFYRTVLKSVTGFFVMLWGAAAAFAQDACGR